MIKTRKSVVALLLLTMMVTIFSMLAMATKTSAAKNALNPVFYAGQVYAHNSKTGQALYISTTNWNWGANNPPMMQIPKEDYWKYAKQGCDGWIIKYLINSKDCTKMRIYNGRTTYFQDSLDTNTAYELTLFVPGFGSEKKFYMDYSVGKDDFLGWDIGGFKVNYN